MTATARPRSATADILLIEDQPHDVELVEMALQRAEVRHVLHVVPDGEDALDYVEGRGRYEGAARPDLIILDLSLPRRSGLEVLSRLKSDPGLKVIPVVVLTSSREETDVWRSYHAHANAYMVKPDDVEDFMTALRRLTEFYLMSAQLPPRAPVERR
ncbi:response regulator [Deinococcus pimensis]|uniref:response regulator n=1 Tax=Deinococcus pimensis TaxID=309888 RepID=UPI000485111C|nr:response regulator [Deinococcus pimensis]